MLLREVGHLLCPQGDAEEVPRARLRKAYPVDTRVRIVGLKVHRYFNGTVGHISRSPTVERERYDVKLEQQHGGNLLRVMDENVQKCIEPPRKGYVLLHSLQTRPELNGQSAGVLGTNHDRITVRTADGSCISVPSGCVLPLATQTSDAQRQPSSPTRCCCICMELSAGVMVADPCGHTDVCPQCSFTFPAFAPCPICRSPVEKYVRMFP